MIDIAISIVVFFYFFYSYQPFIYSLSVSFCTFRYTFRFFSILSISLLPSIPLNLSILFLLASTFFLLLYLLLSLFVVSLPLLLNQILFDFNSYSSLDEFFIFFLPLSLIRSYKGIQTGYVAKSSLKS